jgi:hypothetical protein
MSIDLKASERARQFIERIVEKMLILFPISRVEAVGRVNRQWRHVPYFGDDDIIFHETSEYWAKTIYYGDDSHWWHGEDGLTPVPYDGPR